MYAQVIRRSPEPRLAADPLTDHDSATRLLHGAASIKGIRPENQDRYFAAVSEDGCRAVGAIADGVGGLADGSGAAGAAVHAVGLFSGWLFAAEDPSADEIERRIGGLYAQANEAIVQQAGAPARSGTTLVMVVVTESHLVVANVGDSRAWMYTNPGIDRITADHSVVEELVRDGALSPEQAERSPYRNVLTRSLGNDVPEVDVMEPEDGHPTLARGSAVILTSDGTHGVPGIVDDPRVTEALEESENLDDAAARLCNAAIDAGSRDNATTVIIRRS